MTHGERVGNMIASVVRASADCDAIMMESDMWDALIELRTFMFARVYARDWAADDAKKAMHIVTALVRHYTDHPSQLPNRISGNHISRGYAARRVRFCGLYDGRLCGENLSEIVYSTFF